MQCNVRGNALFDTLLNSCTNKYITAGFSAAINDQHRNSPATAMAHRSLKAFDAKVLERALMSSNSELKRLEDLCTVTVRSDRTTDHRDSEARLPHHGPAGVYGRPTATEFVNLNTHCYVHTLCLTPPYYWNRILSGKRLHLSAKVHFQFEAR